MKQDSQSRIISTGLAIFSMLFGAGNLMYPLRVGMTSGSHFIFGMISFLLTAACLPLAGLIGVMLFNGNYRTFFHRLGSIPGEAAILIVMLVTGPVIAIPRIVTLSHVMIAPFIPIPLLQQISPISSLIFALIFLGITFILTVRENRIVDLLGYVVSPLLLLSLITIFIIGIINNKQPISETTPIWSAISLNFVRGYETLDLLGAIIFGATVLHILRNNIGGYAGYHQGVLAMIGLKAGGLGVTLLGLIYTGMGLLGMLYGAGLSHANEGELFSLISSRVLGANGSIIIAVAVLMACFSTSIALAAVFADYLKNSVFAHRITYPQALVIALTSSIPLSIFGLSKVLALTAGPLVYIGTPVFVTITVCNIAYKLWGFTPIKVPTVIAFIVAIIAYIR